MRLSILAVTLWSLGALGFSSEPDKRVYPETEIYVNYFKLGDKIGKEMSVDMTGSVIGGYDGHVSELSWTFLHSNPNGDIYKITHSYVSGSTISTSDPKEVTYDGKSTILWKDEYQIIVLRPKAALLDFMIEHEKEGKP